MYSKAAFCYEEMLLTHPKNYIINLRYAEVLYSAAKDDYDQLVTARKYFSHAAILKEGRPCARALLGLVQTCSRINGALEANKKLQDSKNAEILATAKRQLRDLYQQNATGQVKRVA
jgi:hypothetical protein